MKTLVHIAACILSGCEPTIPQSAPCVVVLLDYFRTAITYGVEVK